MFKKWWFWVGVIIVIFAIGTCLNTETTETPSSGKTQSGEIELKLSVSYDGANFIVTNNDTVDYTNLKFELNDKYKYHTALVQAGEEFIIDAKKFVDKSGYMFNPATQKPVRMFIQADTPDGKGYLYGTWD